jgi:ABC-type bacteriocin/lantibiotic exporter with double-glycine peptidase domain
MLLIVPVYGLLFYLSNLVNKKWQRRIMEEGAALESLLVQSLNAASTIKKLAIEQHIFEKVRVKYVRLLQIVRHSTWRHTSIHVSADFVTRIFTVLVLWTGCYFVFAKNLTKGELLAFYALISYFTSPVLSLLSINKSVRDALIAADRLFEVMEMEKEVDDGLGNFSDECLGPVDRFLGQFSSSVGPPPVPPSSEPPSPEGERRTFPPLAESSSANAASPYPPLAGVARSAGDGPADIEFKNISFRYGNGKIVLDNISLLIPKGSCVGIKGESGCGKSTLAALLLKLYAPLQGTISINNIDLSTINTKALRTMVVSVPQFTELFNGTVKENIILDKTCDEQKLNNITGRLGILNFFEDGSQGLETVIYEQGTNLSGGQRQLVSIARALYREAPVLILDEPSASLDAETENKIMQTIEWYNKQGNTVIIISHSDAALKICNNIVVLTNGKIV